MFNKVCFKKVHVNWNLHAFLGKKWHLKELFKIDNIVKITCILKKIHNVWDVHAVTEKSISYRNLIIW